MQVWSLGWEDPLEEEVAIHSSILAWRIPWTEEPDRLQSMGSQKSWTGLKWLSNLEADASSSYQLPSTPAPSSFTVLRKKAAQFLPNLSLWDGEVSTQNFKDIYFSFFWKKNFKDIYLGFFPGGSVGKESACSAGDLGSIPGSGRFPGEGNGNQLQYSCLKNPVDRWAWQATVHGVSRVRRDLVTKPPPQILK